MTMNSSCTAVILQRTAVVQQFCDKQASKQINNNKKKNVSDVQQFCDKKNNTCAAVF